MHCIYFKVFEPSIVRRNIIRGMQTHMLCHSEADMVKDFMADLRDFVDAGHAEFRACLLPLSTTLLQPPPSSSTPSVQQRMRSFADTFMRILLSIDQLQPLVMKLLLEKLSEFLVTEENNEEDEDETMENHYR